MQVNNVHSRRYAASVEQVGGLLDSLASDDDRLWPHERWLPMQLDRPLGVGARGGHGPIRYRVVSYQPGRSVAFRFEAPAGFVGVHRFEVEAVGAGRTELRHTIDMQASGRARLKWQLVIRPLHDSLLEDALDKAQAELEFRPLQLCPLPLQVRMLRWLLRRRRGR